MNKNQVLVVMDSFKGSASSEEIEAWVAEGFGHVYPEAEIVKVPIADGGEGTVDALTKSLGGKIINVEVEGPLGKSVEAKYGMLGTETAVIEMAEAAGIILTNQTNEEALKASTFGVGQLILDAVENGAKKIYLGLGGSATTDGGVGMAQALGVSFKKKDGTEISRGAQGLAELVKIDISQINDKIDDVEFILLSDVKNPLVGKHGAAHVYCSQKGLNNESILKVDDWLNNYSQIVKENLKIDISSKEGAGAAGGSGAGMLIFLKASMKNGIEEILRLLNVENLIENSALVLTGEGRMDEQSINGKAPVGISRIAKKYGKPVIAIVGSCTNDLKKVYDEGISLVISMLNQPMSLKEAMEMVEENAKFAGESAARAFLLNKKSIRKEDIR